ncbi:GPW/gp25 family protein [Cellvibrio sp. PSBB023]|jgi:phage baseplate assembly protein W|uniref:GPW/gp25 family protein n=1 Tax=Cellvibrio sp. PSBB023 TaxID=1945512 RepID=UPI00098F3320|nr:GPW/gp25 family protein [Cellvibrio sp. PSBB023]AQT61149.1 phage baseplate protein [Cellvibrio sp. PSBB023]
MSKLNQPVYMDFPLRLGRSGAATLQRIPHIRDQIEMVLFTDPGERWFRPEFGAGIRTLVFEPNGSPLWQITKQRLQASLAEALAGEVAPRDLDINVQADPDFAERLVISISYRLAALNHSDRVEFEVAGGV